jgi:hypothetical protein
MAEITATESRNGNERIYTWSSVTSADTCKSVNIANYVENTVQVFGTVGGSVTMKGSNNNSNFETLLDYLGASLIFTSTGLRQILETPEWFKPEQTGVTSITIVLKLRRGVL